MVTDSERQVPTGRIPVMSTGLEVPEHATAIGDSFSTFAIIPLLGINCNKTLGFLVALSRSLYCETHSIIPRHSLNWMWDSDILDAFLKAPESLTFQGEGGTYCGESCRRATLPLCLNPLQLGTVIGHRNMTECATLMSWIFVFAA